METKRALKFGMVVMLVLLGIIFIPRLVLKDVKNPVVMYTISVELLDGSGGKITSGTFVEYLDPNAFNDFASARVDQIMGGILVRTFELRVINSEGEPNPVDEGR